MNEVLKDREAVKALVKSSLTELALLGAALDLVMVSSDGTVPADTVNKFKDVTDEVLLKISAMTIHPDLR